MTDVVLLGAASSMLPTLNVRWKGPWMPLP